MVGNRRMKTRAIQLRSVRTRHTRRETVNVLVAQVLHYQTFINYTNDLRYQVIGDIFISFIPLESIANEHSTLFDRSRNTKVMEFIFVANRV